MKRDAIERLAIDSAAGELNEDADALFRAYLAEHPQANQWAEDLSRIYEKTEAAINTRIAAADTGAEPAAVRAKPPSQANWRPAARWAAAVIFGAVIGFAAGHWQTNDRTYRMPSPEPGRGTRQVQTASDLQQKYAGTFWGDKMLALLKQRPAQQYKTDSKGVRLWDRYRQYIKEKNHE